MKSFVKNSASLFARILTLGNVSLLAFLAVLLAGTFTQADETQRWTPGVSGSISNASVWENGTALPEGGTGYVYDGVQTITDTSLSGNRTLEFTGGTTSFLSNVNISSGSGFTVNGGTLNTYQITASGAAFNVSGGVWNNGSERIALNGSSTMTLSGSGVLNFKGCYYLNGRDSKGFTVQSGDSVLNLNSVWLSNTAGGWFQIGENTGARGSKYDLHSGTINLNSGEFRVSHGTFTQSGGVFNMSNGSGIVLTDDTDSVFNLSGGTFNMNGAGYINAATGTFNVTGGAINVTPTASDVTAGKKIVGIFRDEATAQNVLSYMTMADGWTAGVVTANNQTMILAGQGAVPTGIKIWKPGTTGAMSDEANWEGTTEDATGYVFSGTNKFTDFSGNLIINGGVNTINTPSNDQTPVVTAGQMLVYNGGDNTLGTGNLTSNGSVYINDGRVKVGNNLRIYGTEADVSYLEVNGTLNVSRWLAIAQGASTSSTAKVVINGGIVYCGSSGAGGLIVGDGTGANGELELNGGTLQVTNGLASNFANAENSVAKFTMTGGTYTTAGGINIGTAKNAKATVEISGGELKSTGTISIGTGSGAKGTVTISGGEVTALRVKVGRKSAGDDAKLTITGGKLIVTQDICGSDSAASGCVYVSDSGQIVFDSTFTSSAGIRELTRFQIAGAGDGTGALRFLKSLECKSQITLTDDATIGIEPGATFTQSAAIAQTQASALTITGGGTLTLSAASTFTGGTTIDSSAVILSGAGTLGTGNITLNDASLTFNGVTSSIASNISGTGDLTVSSGTATLTGTVTQTAGATTLANGTALNFASGTLNNLAVAGEGASAALNVTGDLTLNNDEDTKFIGPISAASITKTGEGTLKLNSGDGTITASNVTVTGGRLDLLGKATGGLTISGAVFSPGNSVGATTITDGGFTLSDDASVILEIGGATPDKNDSLVASGTLNLDGGKIYLTFADACNLKPGEEFTAVFSGSNSASLKNRFIDDYVISYYFTNLQYAPYGDDHYAITGIIDANAVPEPAAWALLILGAFGLMYFRKRK